MSLNAKKSLLALSIGLSSLLPILSHAKDLESSTKNPAKSANERKLEQLKLEKELLELNNQLALEKQRRDMLQDILEKQKLDVNNNLQIEKLKNKRIKKDADNIAKNDVNKKLTQEKNQITLDIDLAKAKQHKKMIPIILEQQRLAIENLLHEEKLKAEIGKLNSEKAKSTAEYELAMQKQKIEFLKLEQEKNQLALKNSVIQLKLNNELSKLAAEKQKIELKNAILQQNFQMELASIKAANDKESLKMARENQKTQMEMAKINLRQIKINQKLKDELNEVNLKNQVFAQKQTWKDKVHKPISYPHTPLDGNTLQISDRRITLDGVIVSGAGKHIAKRINFYNNQSDKEPIFVIINSCPGGSVMAGDRIIRAIESSKAPVYVVVKSFAASMAAIITARAKHSYAYPDAVILHHQMMGIAWGNRTQIQEDLDFMKQWEKRILTPVAEKMGLSLEEFRKKMYENNSGGDWMEFADNAAKHKWVNNVIEEIREAGYIEKPTGSMPKPWWWGKFEEKQDPNGQRYIKLPRLEACDYYFIHNPDHYYR